MLVNVHVCARDRWQQYTFAKNKLEKKNCKESSRRQLHAEQEESGQQRAVGGGGGLVLSEESIKDIVLLEYGQKKKTKGQMERYERT